MKGHVRQRVKRKGAPWSYVIDIGRDEAGKRKQKWVGGFGTRREAEEALRAALTSLQHGRYVEPSKQTVTEYLREWIIGVEPSLKATTSASYGKTLEDHVIPHIGTLLLKNLDGQHLANLYATLLQTGRKDNKGGLSPSTVRYIHAILRRALRDAVRRRKLVVSPTDEVDPPKIIKQEMKTWTSDQARRFIDTIKSDRLIALYVLALTTGMRRGEIAGLRWSDVDLEAGRLAVQQTIVAIGYEVRVSEPKTKRSRRSIALDPDTVAVLRAHKARQAQERLLIGPEWKAGDLVFSSDDGMPLHPMSISEMFKRRAAAAGLPAIRFHDLRHTYASLALAAGVHPKVVSDRLGHSSITITLDTYSHAIPALQEEAATKVASMIL